MTHPSLVALALILVGAAGVAQEQATKTLDAARRAFVHDPKIRVRAWATEKDIGEPVALVWDDAGRAWILCADGVLRMRDEAGFHEVGRFEAPGGLAPHGGGVLVARQGALEFVKEGQGGEAPTLTVLVALEPEALLSDLAWDLDGWLYAVHRGGSATPDGIVRWRPGRSVTSVVALDEPRALALSGDGELFVATAQSHYLHVVVPDAAVATGRVGGVTSFVDGADHSIVQRLEARSSTSALFGEPGGNCVFEGSGWPAAFEQNYLVTEPAGGLVHRDLLTRWGVSFRAKRSAGAELLASSDPAFRPIGVVQGPEGRLYVLDAFAGKPGGRIWELDHGARIVTASRPLDPLHELETEELVEELLSGSRWTRETAHRLLRERGLDRAFEEQLVLRTRRSPDPLLRMHVLWLLSDRRPLIAESVASFDPRVRVNALRAFLEDSRSGAGLSVRALERRVHDGDGRVRIAAWRAWRAVADVASYNTLALLVPQLEDDWTRSLALAIAAERPATFLSAALRRPPGAELYELATLVSEDVVRRGDTNDAVEMVLELAGGDDSPRIVSTVLRTLMRSKRRAPWPSARLSTTLRRLTEHDDLRIASAAMPLARTWLERELGPSELDDWGARILAVVQDEDRSLELRLSSLGVLVAMPETRDGALAAADGLLEHPAWAGAMLDAVEDGTVSGDELGDERTARLRRHADEAVRTRAERLLP